jgi:hypothetical protein
LGINLDECKIRFSEFNILGQVIKLKSFSDADILINKLKIERSRYGIV